MAARRLKATKAFFLKVLGRLVYRRIVLVERELRDLWMEHSSDLPVTVRRLQRRDVQAYVEFREKQTAEEVSPPARRGQLLLRHLDRRPDQLGTLVQDRPGLDS
jgi:hypothetical protein